jgi:NADH dehydrogenase
MVGVKLSGFPAWWAARTYHLALMPGAARRLRLVIDWSVGLLFGRAAAELGQLGHPPPLDRGESLANRPDPG